MREQPLVSVLVAVYNGERFLKKTIQSVLNQTYKNLEIIIIDDASTDSGRDIIKSFSDERMKVVLKDKNENVCCVANLAFEMATGKYCAVIGHDDIWNADKIEHQVRYLEEHEECGACFTRCNIINQKDEVINGEQELYQIFNACENGNRYQHIERLYLNQNYLCAPSVMLRMETLRQVGGYDYSLLQIQDYELWLRILTVAEIFILEEKLTDYRIILDKRSNLSTLNEKSTTRLMHEMQYCREMFLYYMSDMDFKRIFANYFRNKQSSDEKELLCERMFFLQKIKNPYWSRRCAELLKDNKCRKLLEEMYAFTVQDYYEWNSETLFLEPGPAKNINPYKQMLSDPETKTAVLDAKQTKKYMKFLWYLISDGKVKEAREYYDEMKPGLCVDTDVETLEVLFEISEKEKNAEVQSIFDDKSSLQDVLDCFERLKFLIRRYDFDVFGPETKEEFVSFVERNHISSFAIIRTVETSMIHRTKVLNEIAMILYDAGKIKEAIQILGNAYAKSQDETTVYNFSAVLFCSGHKNLAEKIIAQSNCTSERILELKTAIEGGRNSE